MTKVYEALKQAEMYRENMRTKTSPMAPKGRQRTKRAAVVREEAMVALYQAIGSALPDTPRKIIQFVSSRGGEGTSTMVKELADISARRMNKSVLIIDADTTRPTQHRFFGVSPEHCLEDAIRSGGPTEILAFQPDDAGLSVGLLSRKSTSVCELLDSRDTTCLFDSLRERFDLVLIDSSSVTTSPDCLSICARVDGVVLVVEAENTRWPIAAAARDKIIKSGGNLLGIVLNKRRFHIPRFIHKRL